MVEMRKFVSITILFLFFISIVTGFVLGKLLLAKTISGSTAISFFIARPLYSYSVINNRLYSNNPIERLTGYCTLYDLNIVDNTFLYERYKQEDTVPNKRMVLNILSLKPQKQLYHFLDEVYELSDKDLKMQIVKIVKKHFHDKLDEFAQKHNVDVQWIHSD
ncbi:MAG: hypothetical protein N3F66_05180 [Spirochaetes bacterium]|nr:hypothetical protein [Spirochaetota bacterium]